MATKTISGARPTYSLLLSFSSVILVQRNLETGRVVLVLSLKTRQPDCLSHPAPNKVKPSKMKQLDSGASLPTSKDKAKDSKDHFFLYFFEQHIVWLQQ